MWVAPVVTPTRTPRPEPLPRHITPAHIIAKPIFACSCTCQVWYLRAVDLTVALRFALCGGAFRFAVKMPDPPNAAYYE